VDEGEVWKGDGTSLHELVDGYYVLRKVGTAPRAPQVPIELPDPLASPTPCLPTPAR
jgi:hypothetical protein